MHDIQPEVPWCKNWFEKLSPEMQEKYKDSNPKRLTPNAENDDNSKKTTKMDPKIQGNRQSLKNKKDCGDNEEESRKVYTHQKGKITPSLFII